MPGQMSNKLQTLVEVGTLSQHNKTQQEVVGTRNQLIHLTLQLLTLGPTSEPQSQRQEEDGVSQMLKKKANRLLRKSQVFIHASSCCLKVIVKISTWKKRSKMDTTLMTATQRTQILSTTSRAIRKQSLLKSTWFISKILKTSTPTLAMMRSQKTTV